MVIPKILDKRLLTPEEAVFYLGISERKLQYLRIAGEVIQTRLPDTKKHLNEIFDLDGFVDEQKSKFLDFVNFNFNLSSVMSVTKGVLKGSKVVYDVRVQYNGQRIA